MMEDKIAQMLIKSGCYVNSKDIKEDIIKTPNGDSVSAYLSCRLAISDVKVRNEIENELAKTIKEKFSEKVTIVGMATAGITWAHAIAQKLELPLLYIRSSEKSYGLKGLIEGNLKYISKKAIIVEDVLYKGNTIQRGIEILNKNGIETVGVACIATLGDKVEENLLNDNINIVSLTNYKSILNSALEEKIINEKEYESMKLIYEEK